MSNLSCSRKFWCIPRRDRDSVYLSTVSLSAHSVARSVSQLSDKNEHLTGGVIFKGVDNVINKKNPRWKNLNSINNDGGENICGENKGLVALVSKAVDNDDSKSLILHCITHLQLLCQKRLDMS